MNDSRNRWNVDTTCCHICCNQHNR
jgi:hypothetical protein